MPKSALALLGLACLIQIASGQGGTAPHGDIVCASAKICSSTDDRCLKNGGGFGIVPKNQANEWVIRRDAANKYNFQVKDHSYTSYLGIDGNPAEMGIQACSNNMFTDDRQQTNHKTQGFTIEPYVSNGGFRTSPMAGGCQIKWWSGEATDSRQAVLSSKICGSQYDTSSCSGDGGGSCFEHDPRADDKWIFHGCSDAEVSAAAVSVPHLTSCFQPTTAAGEMCVN